MIDDLDKTLAVLLRRELPPALASQVSVSFATPDAKFPPSSVTLPTLNFFLYDVRENWERRSNEWLAERHPDGRGIQRPPPARVDCSYLVTAWGKSSPDPAEEEHSLLGAAMRVLLRHRRIPAEVLQGSLQSQELPVRAATLQPTLLQSLGELWQAMGGRPRAVLNYTVTICIDVQEPEDLAAVTGVDVGFGGGGR